MKLGFLLRSLLGGLFVAWNCGDEVRRVIYFMIQLFCLSNYASLLIFLSMPFRKTICQPGALQLQERINVLREYIDFLALPSSNHSYLFAGLIMSIINMTIMDLLHAFGNLDWWCYLS
ncbi:hypothetical protein MANES_05G023100v8 [Manihot esculenta]|uniref:Uncharacterized protein n=1 Tax=Manihot esculenta TaxID=3983 RepID=A0ACB7HL62_MANES|nr:hypothetical protein MANES_05G023100v8 [Manihot esculenta]